MKKTPWFPPDVQPVHPGVYEVEVPLMVWFRKWDGTQWCAGADTPEKAALHPTTLLHVNENRWRGLEK